MKKIAISKPMVAFSFFFLFGVGASQAVEKQTIWLKCVVKSAASQRTSTKDFDKAFRFCEAPERDYKNYLLKTALKNHRYTASEIIRELKSRIKSDLMKSESK